MLIFRAKRTVEEIFDGVYVVMGILGHPFSRVNIRPLSVRERLKEVLRLYELRERHFECVIRSKELEVLLSRARAAEQRQLAEGEKARADKLDEEVGFRFLIDVTRIRQKSTILITSHSFALSRTSSSRS